ncbi:LysE family translocator [Phreatobacter stygius]|uniref:LysE family translocator n=1 Tax=Phreatobacter stygius TaxID=1940610 RepID=A0A4D7ATG4_9HYPH|nr:LysE family translocator [Phreatobacter stygius]QCI64834.1 LysE family translocator [Phreatobacter stygius]
MNYAENLWLFFVLLFGIIIVPGMDMVFVLANSLTGGRRQGLAATAGIIAGGVFHGIYAALGVGLLLRLVPGLFTVLLLAGAAYIVWIGWTLLRSSVVIGAIGSLPIQSLWTSFRQGIVTSLLNPKAYLFMLAVYPQFLKPEFGPIWAQAIVLAVMTAATQLAVYGGVALAGSSGRDWLTSSPGMTVSLGRGAGVVLITVAVVTAWQGLS